MVDDGYELETALKRAAHAHGINLNQTRPPIEALRNAIQDYRELFRPQQAARLKLQRGLALEAMRAFAPFRPRLIGALIHGDGPLDTIRLALYADNPEQLMLYMSDRQMPWQAREVTLHFSGGRRTGQPALGFLAGETGVELVILDERSRSDPPRDPVTGGRLEMLDTDGLEALIDRSRP